ncbi:MAG: type 1 glutamine amidotransferase [Gammaproteobacteria bacterium]
MKPIRIFRHIATEGPGYFASYLDSRKLPYELVCIDAGDAISQRVDDVSGLVFMGGPMSVNDDLPWIRQELGLIRRAADISMPVLGHCLGGQLISKALGGSVTENPDKEIGWHPVQVVDNEAARDWLAELPDEFEVFHWHGETFSLPQHAAPLLRSGYCANQAFTIGNMLALQCHIEMTAAMVEEWIKDSYEFPSGSLSVQSLPEIRQNLPAKIDRLQHLARILYNRWLRPIIN